MVKTGSSPAPTSRPSSGIRCFSSTACRVLLAAGLLAGGGSAAWSQEDGERAKEIAAYCAKAYCREARTVKVSLEDGSTFERAVPRLPIVLPNGWITVFAGEEIHIELTVAEGKITRARAVPKVTRRNATISLSLRQQPGSAQTELSVKSGLPRNLKYTLGMMLPKGPDVIPSPSCPVQAGVTAHEAWPQPVFQVVIRDLRLLAEDAALTCR